MDVAGVEYARSKLADAFIGEATKSATTTINEPVIYFFILFIVYHNYANLSIFPNLTYFFKPPYVQTYPA